MPFTRVAAYHSAPFSPQNNKAISLVHQASESSASLVVFQNHTSASPFGAPSARQQRATVYSTA
ncbi:hypothetical protein N7494_010873 [Penicillium frequentans]|uniref:Uncharacterized protein n=1 Tax=Penicillium frequentans TaxID=3151616 RepID=A0AAD6G946_9EURO|nr:hypothetical protein N7494_010873 [Penicillium glabrum]